MGERVYAAAYGFDDKKEVQIYLYAFGVKLTGGNFKKVVTRLDSSEDWYKYVENKHNHLNSKELTNFRNYLDFKYRASKFMIPGYSIMVVPMLVITINLVLSRMLLDTGFWGLTIGIVFITGSFLYCIKEYKKEHLMAMFYEDYIKIINKLIEYCEN